MEEPTFKRHALIIANEINIRGTNIELQCFFRKVQGMEWLDEVDKAVGSINVYDVYAPLCNSSTVSSFVHS